MNTCVEWEGTISGDGYGAVKIKRRQLSAHRVAWENANGAIPKEMWVLHRCDNPKCVNVEHLFLGTPKDNIQDCIRKGRRNNPHGASHWNSKLDEPTVQLIRMCRGEMSQKEMAGLLDVSVATISRILKGITWKHVVRETSKC